MPLAFELELDEMHALNEQSHGFPILQCALPRGTIPPRGSVSVPFHFHPLEPREYAVAITVLLGGGSRRESDREKPSDRRGSDADRRRDPPADDRGRRGRDPPARDEKKRR